ncbi:MAG: glycosyl hydrolase family 28 protein [Flavobacteriales bacterium]
MIRLLFAFIATTMFKTSLAGDLNVKDFGASKDTFTLSTAAIQSAIDSSYSQGGGRVVFPAGDYKTGTIVLKDGVTLYLESGANIHASQNIDDYRAPLEYAFRPMLIYANGAKNIGIQGKGSINGHAKRVYEDLRKTDGFIANITENARKAGVEMKMYYVVNPSMGLVSFVDCKDIKIEGVSFIESSVWTIHILKCERVSIDGVIITTSLEKGVNADGIDINSTRDVNITNCQISTGDDAIVLKSWFQEFPCENVIVSNCTLESSSTALKIGTESHGDFREIEFTNCVVKNSNRGLSIVVRDGATVERVKFSNIKVECTRRHFNWWGNADPIWIYLSKRYPNSRVGFIRDVRFENIVATGMGTSKIESTEGVRLENIQFINVQLKMDPENYIDKRADDAFYAENVRNLLLERFTVKWNDQEVEEGWRHAIRTSNIDGLVIRDFSGSQGLKDSKDAVILLHETSNTVIENSWPTTEVGTMVRVSGSGSQKIFLNGIDPMDRSKEVLVIDKEVQDKSSILITDR